MNKQQELLVELGQKFENKFLEILLELETTDISLIKIIKLSHDEIEKMNKELKELIISSMEAADPTVAMKIKKLSQDIKNKERSLCLLAYPIRKDSEVEELEELEEKIKQYEELMEQNNINY